MTRPISPHCRPPTTDPAESCFALDTDPEPAAVQAPHLELGDIDAVTRRVERPLDGRQRLRAVIRVNTVCEGLV